jgi:predicted secreted protein
MRAAVSLALLMGLIVAACSTPATPGPGLTVDCAAFETEGAVGVPVQREIAAGVNQTVTITLCSNPSTGFGWDAPVAEGDAKVELVERAIHEIVGGAPGAAGQEQFTFRTVSPGQTVIHFAYSQPWDGGTKGAWLLDLTTTVSEDAAGG